MNFKNWQPPLIAILSLATLLNLPARAADDPASPNYHFLKEIPIGGDGGWDYLTIDEAARRLYVTHGTKIVVVDIDAEKIVGEIADTQGVHGFALVPKYKLGFSSNGKENNMSMVELKTLKTKSKVKTGANPDAVVYDPDSQQIYAFNGHDNTATIVEGDDADPVTTIKLPGKPEFAVVDPKAARIYCNIEDKNVVAVINTSSHKVVGSWPIAPGEGASGMAIDLAHHRLFLGCGATKSMVMMDSTNGKVVASVPTGAGVDANAFDPGTQLAFSSNGEGNVTIAHEDSPDKLTVVQTLTTHPGSRTMALDPKTHKIYLATAEFEAAAPDANAPRQRPKIVAGSFKILVYGI